MKNVLVDIETGNVVGFDRQPLPFEKAIKVADDFNPTIAKQKEEGMKQKTDENGQPIFMDNIAIDDGEIVSFDEVTYDKVVTKFEEKEVSYTIVNEKGDKEKVTNTVQEPVEYRHLDPVLVPNIINYQIQFADHYMETTEHEIVQEKVKHINDNSLSELIYFDEQLSESVFSTELSTHSSDMGVGFVSVHPQGQIRTIKLHLMNGTQTISVKRVEVYLEAQAGITVELGSSASNFVPVVNGVATFETPVSEVYVRFKNTAETKREIHAFGLLV